MNEFIKVVDADEYFNKCTSCGTTEDTKKIVVGNKLRTNAFILCKECRAELYKKLKESYGV